MSVLQCRMEKYKYFKLEQLVCNSKQTFIPDTDTGMGNIYYFTTSIIYLLWNASKINCKYFLV